MTLLVGQVVCALAGGGVLAWLRKRRAKQQRDIAWADAFIAVLRGES